MRVSARSLLLDPHLHPHPRMDAALIFLDAGFFFLSLDEPHATKTAAAPVTAMSR